MDKKYKVSYQKKIPTIPPMLTPATLSIGIPCSIRALMTPKCAQPLAPPPPRTRVTSVPVKCRAGNDVTYKL